MKTQDEIIAIIDKHQTEYLKAWVETKSDYKEREYTAIASFLEKLKQEIQS